MSRPDFDAGDVVVVVDASPSRWHEPKASLTLGAEFMVLKVARGLPRWLVKLAGLPTDVRNFDARRFRKRPPIADFAADKADHKFCREMQVMRPKKERTDA